MKKIILLWNTVRFLKPIQIYWRIWLRFYKPKINLSSAPRLRQASDQYAPIIKKHPCMELPNKFTFLNEAHSLATASDWNNSGWEKLWLYNLHYFDYLNAIDSDEKASSHQELIQRWIDENRPADGNGWEPYPTSLRIVNWIKWANQGNELEFEWQHSLAVQVRHLRNQLEYHLLGNHLFANAKALVFAGLFFEGKEATAWLSKGLEILEQELPEQILDDGGHFELSPMYHSIILEDILDLINLSRVYDSLIDNKTVSYWECLAKKMLAWLELMIHPDGKTSLFNDAAFGIASKPEDIFKYAARLSIKSNFNKPTTKLLSSSGYAHIEKKDVLLLADVGKIGPDYLPGHAHADTLSFELSLYGQRVIVDSGTSCYGYSDERLRQRSTAAHNTIEVDGNNSSEVWSGFRVAGRASPLDVQLKQFDHAIQLSAAHDGYRRLDKATIHHREWHLEDRKLVIEDYVTGTFNKAEGRLLFSPKMVITKEDENNKVWLISLPNKKTIKLIIENSNIKVTNSTYHPEFGQSIPTKCLVYSVNAKARVLVSFIW